MDEQQRTSEPSIYAIGDVVGEPMLAHKASHEARVAVEAAFGQRSAFEPAAIPAVVFTDGLAGGDAEQQARRGIRPVEVTRFPWAASATQYHVD